MKSCLLFFACLLTTLPYAFAQTSASSVSASSAAETSGAARGSISDVRFVEGSWQAVAGDRSIDAVWSSPDAESMVGFVRVKKDGHVALYELFAFEQTEKGLIVSVRHFAPGLVASEEKENPNRYHFLEAGNGQALFEKQGEAVRVRYEKRSEDAFAIVIGKPQNGNWVFKDFWVFSRVK